MNIAMTLIIVQGIIALFFVIGGIVLAVLGKRLFLAGVGMAKDTSAFEVTFRNWITFKAKPGSVGAVMCLTAPICFICGYLVIRHNVEVDEGKGKVNLTGLEEEIRQKLATLSQLREDIQKVSAMQEKQASDIRRIASRTMEFHSVALHTLTVTGPSGVEPVTIKLDYENKGMTKSAKDKARQNLEDFLKDKNYSPETAAQFRASLEKSLATIPNRDE